MVKSQTIPPSVKKRITQADLARLTGVSQAVVSAVLNDNFKNIGVSPVVAKRIRLKAESLGYRVNSGARAMRMRQNFNLGYFVAMGQAPRLECDNPEYRAGVYDRAAALDYHISMIRLAPLGSTMEQAIPKAFREGHLDALLINQYIGLNPEIDHEITTSDFPVVVLNDKHPINAVYPDEIAAASQMTEYLIAQGYRRITFLAEQISGSHYSEHDRWEGHMLAMVKHGLRPVFQPLPIGDIKKRQTSLQDWLRSDQRPEAVLCADDYYALRVQMSAAEIGLRYPDDFALASVGKEPSLEEYFRVPLTTMLLPRYEMATAAVTMAIAMVNAAVSLNQPAQVFQSQLCPGESAPACNSEQQSGEILKNSVAR